MTGVQTCALPIETVPFRERHQMVGSAAGLALFSQAILFGQPLKMLVDRLASDLELRRRDLADVGRMGLNLLEYELPNFLAACTDSGHLETKLVFI